MSATVCTPMFKVSGGRMARLLWSRHGHRPVLWLGGAVAVLAAWGALADLRLLIVALMILFLALPMVLGFLYLNHGLKKATALNMLEHRVCVCSDSGIWVEVAVRKDDDEDMEIRRVPLEGRYIFETTNNGVTIQTGADGMLYVPYSVWDDDKEAFKRWMDALRTVAVLPTQENVLNSHH